MPGSRAKQDGNNLPLTEERAVLSNVAFCCALTAATSNSKLAWEQGIAGGQHADDCFYHGPAGTVAEN